MLLGILLVIDFLAVDTDFDSLYLSTLNYCRKGKEAVVVVIVAVIEK